MKYRWSGEVDYSDEEARQRLRSYFESLGFQCLQDQPELALQRGSSWGGLFALSPRRIWMQVSAKIQPWGVHTLVDVTFEIALRLRRLSEPEAELLVSETREMVRYLQEGRADFERLETLHRQAVRARRKARWVAWLLFALGFVFGVLAGSSVFDWMGFILPYVGLFLVGILAGRFVVWLLKDRR